MTPWGKRTGMVVHEQEPFNAEARPGMLVDNDITEADAFYSRNHGSIPDIAPSLWRLNIGGLVDRPQQLSLDDLRNMFRHQELTATLQCAGNRRAGLIDVEDIPGEDPWGPGATSTARWAGVTLADVLTHTGIRPDAAHVELLAPDISQLAQPPQVYGSSIPRQKALAAETLLAWEMNGAPLPQVHGGPVRVVVPGYIGARSVKWVNRINALAEPSTNYFQATAYRLLPPNADPSTANTHDGISLGPIALNSAILYPDHNTTVSAGLTEIAGYALAGGDRSIARVDLSTDRGTTWTQAILHDQPSPWSWRLWHAYITLHPGPVEVVARAWDTTAATQPEEPRHLWNPKGYANNSWARIQLTVT